MRQETMTDVWVASHKTAIEYGVAVGGYTDLRKMQANIQTDHSKLDIQTYGETVSEIAHLRCLSVPTIRKGDMLYLAEPAPVGTFVVDGASYDDYGDGDYKVESMHSGYHANPVRNPTVVDARIVTK